MDDNEKGKVWAIVAEEKACFQCCQVKLLHLPVFSVAGRVIEKRRSRLTGANAKNSSFLQENWGGPPI